MASDNEVMVLIYETVQKQLNQIKDSRVVMQSLAGRIAQLELTVNSIKEQTAGMVDRLSALEKQSAVLNANTEKKLANVSAGSMSLKNTVDAMRSTLDNVTNPSIKLISDNSGTLKAAVRELKSVQDSVNDEFETYAMRLMRLEDSVEKMLKKQLLFGAAEEQANE